MRFYFHLNKKKCENLAKTAWRDARICTRTVASRICSCSRLYLYNVIRAA